MYKYLLRFSTDYTDNLNWPIEIRQGDILQLAGLDKSLPEWIKNTKHWKVDEVVHISKPGSNEYLLTVLHVGMVYR